jgi:hypothetical protein
MDATPPAVKSEMGLAVCATRGKGTVLAFYLFPDTGLRIPYGRNSPGCQKRNRSCGLRYNAANIACHAAVSQRLCLSCSSMAAHLQVERLEVSCAQTNGLRSRFAWIDFFGGSNLPYFFLEKAVSTAAERSISGNFCLASSTVNCFPRAQPHASFWKKRRPSVDTTSLSRISTSQELPGP